MPPLCTIEPLPSATVCLTVETDEGITLDWRACIGLRGFMGYRLDEAPKSLSELLLPVFHQEHDQPALFRLVFENSDAAIGHHILRILTFGPHAEIVLTWFADLLQDASGLLHNERGDVPFRVASLSETQQGELQFPDTGDTDPIEGLSGLRLVSDSPYFSKKPVEGLFSQGHWTDLLAIRFADLSGLRRKELRHRLPHFQGNQEQHTQDYPMRFGGKVLSRTGSHFDVHFQRSDILCFRSLELLTLIGIGRHTAYGAGAFQIIPIPDQIDGDF